MKRVYRACPTCRRRMRLIGTSAETFCEPPIPVERYYQCPHCHAEWAYNERILYLFGALGNTPHRVQRTVLQGKPGDDPYHIDRHCNQNMLQMGFR